MSIPISQFSPPPLPPPNHKFAFYIRDSFCLVNKVNPIFRGRLLFLVSLEGAPGRAGSRIRRGWDSHLGGEDPAAQEPVSLPSAAPRRLRGRATSKADPDPSLDAGVVLVASALALSVAGGGVRGPHALGTGAGEEGRGGPDCASAPAQRGLGAAVDVLRTGVPHCDCRPCRILASGKCRAASGFRLTFQSPAR